MTGPASSDAMGEVSGLYLALLEAWNRQDAAGMAALFAAEGVQIGFDGTQVVGPERIQAHLSRSSVIIPQRDSLRKCATAAHSDRTWRC